ncbi:uncharacterized protein MAM_03779 [Metarhizium album ARSEF 1941]|uniref:Nucleotide-binding, alpha-beta plait n=1 Tax=Metarhizium album (strain ARSEF 1941) TaxID=1081103 RepID=A0A0B2X0Q1_METAS|nr:uncharacterized protein MAM_03779 [Metarhizium album ARSEF 1941]KHN98655.1 hypothetical protein MAM_03779 [Metarhizium album ARSEF 1941]
MEPSTPAPSMVMPSGHESATDLMTLEPFTAPFSDASMEELELSKQLRLRRVNLPPTTCSNLVPSLIEQSTRAGRNVDTVLSAGAAHQAPAPIAGRRREGATASLPRDISVPSSRSSLAHGYAHAGFTRPPVRTAVVRSDDVASRIGFAGPHHSANALGYHGSYTSNGAAMFSRSAGYTNPDHSEFKGTGTTTNSAGLVGPGNLARWKGAEYVRNGCSFLSHSHPPAPSAGAPDHGPNVETRGLFGRIQSSNGYPASDALRDAINLKRSTPTNAERALTTKQSTRQLSLAATSAVTTGTQASGFVPMRAVTHPGVTGRDVTPTPLGSQAVINLKFSPNYRGMHTEANASADHLRPDQNCSLWITQLPPDVKVAELLGKIRDVGRVYATVLSPPDGIKHPKSAAKLVFFRPAGAQRLLASANSNPLVIRGHRAQIVLNRTKCGSQSTEKGESRVLIITGHKSFVNESSLTTYFERNFVFQIDKVRTLTEFEDRVVVEYRFGSYRCQSQMGLKALLEDRPRGLEMVEFGADPCEVGSDAASSTVAAARVRGIGLYMPALRGGDGSGRNGRMVG